MLDRRAFALSALGFAALPALARAPLAGKQVPGVLRRKVGAIEVTAISDGTVALPLQVFSGVEPAELQRLMGAYGLKEPPPSAVNAFVINTGQKTYLLDTGTGSNKAFGPTLGRVRENLFAAGIEPSQIDGVILTHAHPDHAEGLITPSGQARFRNAELIVNETEANFWLDEGIASRAPEGAKPFFASAKKTLGPYAKRMRKLKGGEIAPGITLEPAFGHSPGHSIVRVASGNQQMLFTGDSFVNAAIHPLRPDVMFAYDADPRMAVETRKRVFDMAAVDGLTIAATHIAFPGFGRIVKDGAAYRYVPAEFSDVI